MVIDTSALLAIYLAEADSATFEHAILSAPMVLISEGTLLEAGIVVEARHGRAGAVELDNLLSKLGVSTVAVDAEPELRRLLRVRAGHHERRAPAVQGGRLLED